jgi:hypothetical protein
VRSIRIRSLALSLTLLVGGAPVGAQAVPADTLSRARSGWIVGGSLGVPGYESEIIAEAFTIGVHWTRVRPGRLGADFSFGTIPRTLVEGVFVLGLRGGVALPLLLSPGTWLLPSTGASLIGGVSGGGGGGAIGYNAGVAAAFFGTSRTGLRSGITWHRFQDFRGAVWLVEVGFVGIR